MPADSHCDSPPRSTPRRRLLIAAAVAALALPVPPAGADNIPVRDASLSIVDGEVVLTADFGFALTPTLEEALDKGIPLYFTIEFELGRTRFLWFSQKVAHWSTTWRVSYTPLTRQYRVASGAIGSAFDSLGEVERFIGRVAARPVLRADEVEAGVRYDAAIRERLEVNELPKPFQLNALASREWQLDSGWHRFAFTP